MSGRTNSSSHNKVLLFQRSKDRAFDCLSKQEYGRAFAHFIVAFTIQPDIEDELLNTFLYTLGRLSSELEVQEKWNDLFMCYEEALQVMPHNSQVLHGLATVLFRLGHLESATIYFQKAYKENPFFTPSLYCLDNLKSSLVERWHFMMLNDKGRNTAYSKAIETAVKQGCRHVLDIGAGTGILSMMAKDAGAETVYACEGSEVMARILQSVIERNEKNVQIFEKMSFDLQVPGDISEKVDLVITEVFDAGLFGEHILKTMQHAWKCLIKDKSSAEENGSLEVNTMDKLTLQESDSNCTESDGGYCTNSSPGQVIPQSAVLWAVPVECEEVRRYTRVDNEALKLFGLHGTSVTASIPSSEPYSTIKLDNFSGSYKYLSSPKQILTVNFNDIKEITDLLQGRVLDVEYKCSSEGKIDAVIFWFDLQLSEEISISTSPGTQNCWEQGLFYVLPKHLKGMSEYVQVDANMNIEFLCKGHLTLQSVSTVPCDNAVQQFTLDSIVVQEMNSLYRSGVLSLCPLSSLFEKDVSILDISTVPLIGLKCLKNGAKRLATLPSKYLMDMNSLMELCNMPREKLQSLSYDDICSRPLECDLLITEPVEICGLLKKNIFEDIALLRNLFSDKLICIYPHRLTLYSVLIESSDLYEQAKVVSDERCLGYKISESVNMYQCAVHQDIELSKIPHKKLCNPVKLWDIDLNQLSLEKNKLQSFVKFEGSVEVSIIESGKVSAIPYWFQLHYDTGHIIDTSDLKTMWKQAAVVCDSEKDVSNGNTVCLQWSCRNSCLNISVNS